MIVCKPNIRANTTNITLKAQQYTIEQSNKIKILGTILTSGLSNNAYINKITTKVTYRLNILKKVCKYTDRRTTKMLFNSLINSVFKYAYVLS